MRADQLAAVLTPLQGANLRSSVHGVEQASGGGIPELDAAVVVTAPARGKQIALERTPGQGFDCRCVIVHPVQPGSLVVGGSGHGDVPYVKQVVVSSSARQLVGRGGGPFQAADVTRVAAEGLHDGRVEAEIMEEYVTVGSACGEDVVVFPCERRDSTATVDVGQGCEQATGNRVPELDLGGGKTYRDAPAVGGPAETGDGAIHGGELGCGLVGIVPEVDGVIEGDGEHVGTAPVEQVEVEVVLEVGDSEHPRGRFRKAPPRRSPLLLRPGYGLLLQQRPRGRNGTSSEGEDAIAQNGASESPPVSEF